MTISLQTAKEFSNNWFKVLDQNLRDQMDITGNSDPIDKLDYIGETIFGFTTYDGELNIMLANKMFEVLEALINKTTFDYIADSDNYMNYILMMNSPFLIDKADWGSSIRGAWLDDYDSYELDCGRIKIAKGELTDFVKAVMAWAKT